MSTVVLTREDLRLIDPVRMQTQQAITLPGAISGSVRELGVTNDGLVLIDALHQAYSLYDQRVRGPTRRRAGGWTGRKPRWEPRFLRAGHQLRRRALSLL